MKVFKWALFVIFIGSVSCSNQPDDGSAGSAGQTKLVIKNSTTSFLEIVYWFDNTGTKYYFCPDSIWDSGISANCPGLGAGHSSENIVGPGSSSVYFYFVNSSTLHYTANAVTVTAGAATTFTFYASTMIYALSAGNKADFKVDLKKE